LKYHHTAFHAVDIYLIIYPFRYDYQPNEIFYILFINISMLLRYIRNSQNRRTIRFRMYPDSIEINVVIFAYWNRFELYSSCKCSSCFRYCTI